MSVVIKRFQDAESNAVGCKDLNTDNTIIFTKCVPTFVMDLSRNPFTVILVCYSQVGFHFIMSNKRDTKTIYVRHSHLNLRWTGVQSRRSACK